MMQAALTAAVIIRSTVVMSTTTGTAKFACGLLEGVAVLSGRPCLLCGGEGCRRVEGLVGSSGRPCVICGGEGSRRVEGLVGSSVRRGCVLWVCGTLEGKISIRRVMLGTAWVVAVG